MRWLVLLLLLAGVPTVGANWLMPSGDAARTSHLDDPGPAWDDVALRFSADDFGNATVFGSSTSTASMPLIVDGTILVVVQDRDETDAILGYTLWRVPPGSAPERAYAVPYPNFLADGAGHLLFFFGGRMTMLDQASGEALWEFTVTGSVPAILGVVPTPTIVSTCSTPVWRDDLIVAPCFTLSTTPVPNSAYLQAIDAKTGAATWTWRRDVEGRMSEESPEPQGDPAATANAYSNWASFQAQEEPGHLVDGTVGLVSLIDDWVALDLRRFAGQCVNAETGCFTSGDEAWLVRISDPTDTRKVDESTWTRTINPVQNGGKAAFQRWPAATGGNGRIFVEAQAVFAYDNVSGDSLGTRSFRRTNTEPDPGSGLAYDGDLFVLSLRQVVEFDRDLVSKDSFDLPEGQNWAAGAPIVYDDLVVAVAETYDPSTSVTSSTGPWFVYALDRRSLDPVWIHQFSARPALAAQDGLLVVAESRFSATSPGTNEFGLFVIGATPASLQLKPRMSTRYPEPGDVVHVDLGKVVAGMQGPATQFKADWGDGDVTEWVNTTVFAHRFIQPVDTTARFFARNDAGQTTSVPVSFFVGQDRSLTWMQRQFSADNQNTTFFILGLLVTLGAAAFGFLRLRRAQGRLSRQIRDLDRLVRENNVNPAACERILSERLAEARADVAERRLDHGQFIILRDRIEELRRELRLSGMDARLAFLPLGMVEKLHEILHDGKVSAWEREHFLQALDADRLLTGAQKVKVRRMIDEWFERDASPG